MLGISVVGDMWIPTNVAAPVQHTARLIDELRVFNWSSTTNAGVTTMSGAFTKIEPYRSAFDQSYTIRTEHEFAGLAHTP